MITFAQARDIEYCFRRTSQHGSKWSTAQAELEPDVGVTVVASTAKLCA